MRRVLTGRVRDLALRRVGVRSSMLGMSVGALCLLCGGAAVAVASASSAHVATRPLQIHASPLAAAPQALGAIRRAGNPLAIGRDILRQGPVADVNALCQSLATIEADIACATYHGIAHGICFATNYYIFCKRCVNG